MTSCVRLSRAWDKPPVLIDCSLSRLLLRRCKAHDCDRRQPHLRHPPGVAAVLRDPQPAAGRAEGEPLAARVDRKRMAPHQVVSVMLRQTLLQYIEAAAAVAGARNHDFAVDRNAPLVLDRGDEPSGVRVTWMCGDRKAEFRRADRRNLAPCGA